MKLDMKLPPNKFATKSVAGACKIVSGLPPGEFLHPAKLQFDPLILRLIRIMCYEDGRHAEFFM